MKQKTIIIFLVLVGVALSCRQVIKNRNELVTLSKRASYLTTTKEIKSKVAGPLEQMIMDAEKDGMCLVVISAFRTKEYQAKLYANSDKIYVAFPGTSEHEKGIAVDFTACPMSDGVRDDTVERPELANEFDTFPEYQWLVDNAYKYNFEQSYTEDNVEETGFPTESWHWRFTK